VTKRTHVLADLLAQIDRTADGRPVFGLACGVKAAPFDHLLDEKIETYALEHRLLRPGFVRPVDEWMAACDVLIAPSVREPLARTVLEAQCLGIPAITSQDGGLSELVEDGRTGFVCPPNDLGSWISRTRALLDDAALAQSFVAAAREVVAKLTPERNAQDVAGIYAELIAARPTPSARASEAVS